MNPPILEYKDPSAPSVFVPRALLQQARRQKGVRAVEVPSFCILDPDGDIVRSLKRIGRARHFDEWPCYHTELYLFDLADRTAGIIACAVGASFAVLVAEELFASGCRCLLSLTSAGQISPAGTPPYFVVIERALRDEGTSYHYTAPSEFAEADKRLTTVAMESLRNDESLPVFAGASWTTDAPFRETPEAIENARAKGVLAVEMEAAALYAFAEARRAAVVCLAHVTNTMGQAEQDFEKGEAAGSADALRVLSTVMAALQPLIEVVPGPSRSPP